MAIQKRRTRYGMSYGVVVYVRGERTWIGSFDDEDEAKIAEIKAKRARVRRQETVQSFADRWLTDYNRTTKNGDPRWGAKSVQLMGYALRPFTRSFGSTRLRDLTVADVRPWAVQTPYNNVKVVRTMMGDAVRDGLAERNPFAQLRLEAPRGRRDLVVMGTEEVAESIEKTDELAGPTFAAFVAVAAYAGLRPGEIAALEPSDVDVAANEVNVRQSFNGLEVKAPKNGKPRRVVLPPEAASRIHAMPRPLHSRWLFTTKEGHQFRREAVHRNWHPIRCVLGRPQMAFYEWRHTAATLLLMRGLTPELVAFQLGHTDGGKLVRTLYGHPEDSWQREQIKRAFREPVPIQAAEEREAASGDH